MATEEFPVLVLNVQLPSLKSKATHGKPAWKLFLTKIFQKILPWKMHDSHESYVVPTMTQSNTPQYSGPPAPIIELTLEQDLRMRQIEDALRHPSTQKEDIITVFIALQRQAFMLGNNMTNLLKEWNKPQDLHITKEDLSNLGITFETKD